MINITFENCMQTIWRQRRESPLRFTFKWDWNHGPRKCLTIDLIEIMKSLCVFYMFTQRHLTLQYKSEDAVCRVLLVSTWLYDCEPWAPTLCHTCTHTEISIFLRTNCRDLHSSMNWDQVKGLERISAKDTDIKSRPSWMSAMSYLAK